MSIRRVPEWVKQVVCGLSDGKDWIIQKLNGSPAPVRYGNWVVAQAILFKLQPWLWQTLVDVVGIFTDLLERQLHVQLLIVVLAFLTTQTLLIENRFKRTWNIVESMDKSLRGDSAMTDGGSTVKSEYESFKRSSWRVHVVCGAIGGGVVGVNFGPAGVIGLAILGAMVGSDWAKHTLED